MYYVSNEDFTPIHAYVAGGFKKFPELTMATDNMHSYFDELSHKITWIQRNIFLIFQ